MNEIFSVKKRHGVGKGYNRKLRHHPDGLPYNPGVVYGRKESINIEMRSDHAVRFIRHHVKSGAQAIDLKIDDGDNSITKRVILQDYQLQPSNNRLLHVDFREVSDRTVVSVDVNVNTVGVSKGVKAGGIVQIILHSIPLRGQINQIPANIDIDITELDFGDTVHISDIKLPPKVTVDVPSGTDLAILTISAPVEEKEEEEQQQEVEAPATEEAKDNKKAV